ncbi:DUF308 domain-containing protein [Leucobacter salsicius]|uniref:DUF308 domain-containing protein n=1 Tax=Leucobacter salsicius TaxID=664638 RepID=UPI000344F4B4|nr:DUF308 domain-containing protein [Leucobacter salsicius]
MTAANMQAAEAVTPPVQVSRAIRLVRVIVLIVAGLAVAFTAPMHEQIGFDQTLLCISLAGLGIAHLLHALAARGRGGSPIALMLGIVAIAAAVLVPLSGMASPDLGVTTLVSITLAVWALVSGLLEFICAFVQPGSRQDALLLGALGVLLSMLILVFRNDPVAVIGFFGAYAVLAGVFLGISAFDNRAAGAAAAVTAANAQPQ